MDGGRASLLVGLALALVLVVGCGDKRGVNPPDLLGEGASSPIDPALLAALDRLVQSDDVAAALDEILRHDDPRAINAMVAAMGARPANAHAIRIAIVSMRTTAAGALRSLVESAEIADDIRARSALLLGDLRARVAVRTLVQAAGIDSPIIAPALHALRLIGDARGARGAEHVWKSDVDPLIRALALDVFSYLTSDAGQLPVLAAMFADETEPESVRAAAGLAYGRLVYAVDQLGPLLVRQAAFAALYGRSSGGAANSYLARQRVVSQHIVRAIVGVSCTTDPGCYLDVLDRGLDALRSDLGTVIPDLALWTQRERDTLVLVAFERAYLELGKLGAAARPILDAMLERAGLTDALGRQGSLLVISLAAQRPCAVCAARLDEIATADRGDPALQELREETEVVQAYLMTQP